VCFSQSKLFEWLIYYMALCILSVLKGKTFVRRLQWIIYTIQLLGHNECSTQNVKLIKGYKITQKLFFNWNIPMIDITMLMIHFKWKLPLAVCITFAYCASRRCSINIYFSFCMLTFFPLILLWIFLFSVICI